MISYSLHNVMLLILLLFPAQCIPGEFTMSEEQEIAYVANNPPCFVVFGESTFAKAAVVNRLLILKNNLDQLFSHSVNKK